MHGPGRRASPCCACTTKKASRPQTTTLSGCTWPVPPVWIGNPKTASETTIRLPCSPPRKEDQGRAYLW
ncbi:hypothetical protein B0T26DRAFT_87510 [Lasiosphaeria miniovina]|uniref:Uncharacterized protein n=1 Tax=Lasiosphaeria miniovina TaxID=1954250 RepID=A0AA40BIN8_9PEZI|nr:uncharacterized protein B0T26DRAFT_87510 [Lasiosphaeria miniovina]KAK0734927.1 hypothetical protein B0T26DRAFT_87510 [Lasiosphaeria miniovina]